MEEERISWGKYITGKAISKGLNPIFSGISTASALGYEGDFFRKVGHGLIQPFVAITNISDLREYLSDIIQFTDGVTTFYSNSQKAIQDYNTAKSGLEDAVNSVSDNMYLPQTSSNNPDQHSIIDSFSRVINGYKEQAAEALKGVSDASDKISTANGDLVDHTGKVVESAEKLNGVITPRLLDFIDYVGNVAQNLYERPVQTVLAGAITFGVYKILSMYVDSRARNSNRGIFDQGSQAFHDATYGPFLDNLFRR